MTTQSRNCGRTCAPRTTNSSLLTAGDQTAQNLAQRDAMRLLVTFSRMLPVSSTPIPHGESQKTASQPGSISSRAVSRHQARGIRCLFRFHWRGELIQAGQTKTTDKRRDILRRMVLVLSRSKRQHANVSSSHALSDESAKVDENRIAVRQFTISTQVLPPKQIIARARVECEVWQSGSASIAV